MSASYLMGLDVGGGGGRCLLVHVESGGCTSAFRPWTLQPAPEVGGFAYRLDPALVWRTLGETAREALRLAGATADQVCGVAATSMRHSTVVLDASGGVLLMAPNRDARAAAHGMQLAAERGEEFHRATGRSPSPIFLAARLLWLKESDPAAFRSAVTAMCISDWVGYRMTAERASEYAQAGESLLLDLKSRKWSTAILKSLDLPEGLLPPLRAAGSKLGKLTKEAAADLGLVPGTPVAVGGPDTQCGLLGSGAVAGGALGVIAGTTTPIQLVIQQPVFDPAMRLWTGLHVIPGQYVLESNAGQMGATLDWMARLIYPGSPNPVARLAAEAEASEPGAHGMVSTIGAAIFNSAAMEPPVDTLTFSSVLARGDEDGRADLARAVLEGMAYAVRANIEQILEVSGSQPAEVHVSGGISRSPLWTRLLSEVLRRPVHVSASAEATALGAAICAGVAAGVFRDLPSGAQALGRTARQHQPGPDSSSYQRLYSAWRELLSARRPADVAAIGQITETMMAGLEEAEAGAGQPQAVRPRIYVSAEVDEAALKRLSELGEVTYRPYRQEGILLTGDDLVGTLQGYQVFVTEVDIVDAACLLRLPDLRVVVVCRGSPVNVDIEACTAAGVPVTNTPARNADAVADLAVGFLLMLARRLQPATAFLRQPGGEAGDLGRMGQAHEQFLGVELWRKTIGLIGGGAIGRKVGARVLPFGARVLLFDPFISAEGAARMGAEKVSFERLLAESDFISLHAAVTDETRGMLNAAAFERMKAGAFLVNTARAALVDQPALLSALQTGRLGGYATDVFPVEPPGADDPLLAFPNVVATLHLGGNTREVAAHQGEIIHDELRLLLAGQRPKHILNPAALQSFRWLGSRTMDEAGLQARTAGPGPGASDLDVNAQRSRAAESRLEPPAPQTARTDVAQTMETDDARQKMIAILKEFTARIAADPDMAGFAKGKNVVFTFTVKDLDQAFHLSFVNGQAAAGLEAPPREPDVKLKMAADILDGMFTGRVNATKAATTGKLAFSGDTGKAMAFMRIQGNMSRLYTEARAKVGDPGDLTRIGAAPAPIPPSTVPAPSAPAPAAPPPAQAVPTSPGGPPPAQAVPATPAAGAESAGRRKMVGILQEFTAAIRADKGMADFSRGKNVVFLFTVKDLEQSFFLSFIEGKLDAGLQAPPRDPDVKLKMAADILDGMFTGRINATKAATTGKLSFSGDTGKAMAFMRIQKEMGRLYAEARHKVGDPGDLTRIGAAPAPVPQATIPAPTAAAAVIHPAPLPAGGLAASVPSAPKTGDVRDQILMVTSELYANGLITATGGNVSARCDDKPDEIWITPSAIFKGDLRADMMVRIDLDGRILGETDYGASSERRVHCAIYKNMPDVSAVIHSHAEQATLMALTGTPFQPISADAAFFGDIPVVPFIMPGSDELGIEVARAMQANGIAVLMQNHGLVVAGSSLRRAADMTEIIEITAHKLLTCRMLGVEPALLPEEVVAELKEVGRSVA